MEEHRRRLRETEEILARREEEARRAAEEAARLRAERDDAIEQRRRCEAEKEKEKDANNKQWQESFQQRWEEIIERVDKSASQGGISPEQLQQIVDRVKERFSESESFQEARRIWKEKVELLENHLEQERIELKKQAGENGELRARCETLQADLEEAKKQLEDAKQRLKDEREIQESKMAELEEQVRQEQRKEVVKEDYCINGCPLDVAEETEIYRAILDMVEALGRPSGLDEVSEGEGCQMAQITNGQVVREGQSSNGYLQGWQGSGQARERVLMKEKTTRMQMESSRSSFSQQSTMRVGKNGQTNIL